MKKLLIFHTCLPSYRIDLFNYLSKYFNAKIILFGNDKQLNELGFDIDDIKNQAKINYERRTNGFYIGNHLISLMYYREIKRIRPDLVWCQELGVNTIFSILLKPFFGYKIIMGCDDSLLMLENYSIKRKILRWIEYKFIDKILVVNKEVKKHLKTLFPNNKFYYLPIIQDEIRFKEDLQNTSHLTTSLIKDNCLQDKKIFLFVGRLEEIKRPIQLIKAFQKANINDAVLCYIGTGSLEQELQQILEQEQITNIIYKGKLTGLDLYAWYNIADYLILPSTYECFGAVVNEALNSGCKVIVSDSVGASTLIDNNNGYIFPYKDMNELTKIIIKCNNEGKKRDYNSIMNFKFKDMCDTFVQELNKL